jgi:hypothetical protein
MNNSGTCSGGRRRRGKSTVGRRRKYLGGSYGFGGSILGDAGGTNAGSAQWNKQAGECGGAEVANRGGNNTLAGGRRRRRNKKNGRKTRRRRSYRGGNILALTSPRAGYTFDGSGAGGIANAVPVGGKSVPV